jgi:hypothetical protein
MNKWMDDHPRTVGALLILIGIAGLKLADKLEQRKS